MNDDEPRNFKPFIYGLVIVAMVAAGWFSRPLYRQWKKQRYLANADAYLAKGDYKNAALSARQVLTLDSVNVRALTVMSVVLARVHSPDLVNCRQSLLDIDPDNVTNRIALAEAALSFGDSDRAEQALVKVPGEARGTVAFHQLAAFILAGQRKLSEAEAHFAAALKLEPTNSLLRINHAVVLMQARDTNIVLGAIQTLEQSATNLAYRSIALQNLAQGYAQLKQFDQALTAAKSLLVESNSTLGHRLLALSIAHQGGSTEYPALLADAKKAVGTESEMVQPLAAWLIASQQVDEALTWLTGLPAATQAEPRIAACLADAHLVRRDWPVLQKLTATGNWGGTDFFRLSLQSRAARELGQNVTADAAWLGAVRAAGNNPRTLGMLARQAGAWGWAHEQEEILWTLTERHPGERWAPETLTQLLNKKQDTRGMHRLASLLLKHNPANLAAKNNVAGTSLLLNTQLPRAHEFARELFRQHPSNAVFVSTYAYSLHVQGKRGEALKAFANLSPEALTQPAIALYYGIVLGTNSPAEARKHLTIAATATLLPEEKALLNAALKQLPPSS